MEKFIIFVSDPKFARLSSVDSSTLSVNLDVAKPASSEEQTSSAIDSNLSREAACLETTLEQETVVEFLHTSKDGAEDHGERKTDGVTGAEGSVGDAVHEQPSVQDSINRESQLTGNTSSLCPADSSTTDAMKIQNSITSVTSGQSGTGALEEEPSESVDSRLAAVGTAVEGGACGSSVTNESVAEKEVAKKFDICQAMQFATVELGSRVSCANENETQTVHTKCDAATNFSPESAADDSNNSSRPTASSECVEVTDCSELANSAPAVENSKVKSAVSKGQVLYSRVAAGNMIEGTCMGSLSDGGNPVVNQGIAAASEDCAQTLETAVTTNEVQTNADKTNADKKKKKKEKKKEKEKKKDKQKKKEKKNEEDEEEETSSLPSNPGDIKDISTMAVNADKQPLQRDTADIGEARNSAGQPALPSSVGTAAATASWKVAVPERAGTDGNDKSTDAKKLTTTVENNQKMDSSDTRVSRFHFGLLTHFF